MYRVYELTDKERKEGKIIHFRHDGDTHYYDIYESKEEWEQESERLMKIAKEARKEKLNYMKSLYPKADSQGEHIDSLREEYPYRIRKRTEPDYEGTLSGIQEHKGPVVWAKQPLYTFPGGECAEDPFGSGIEIVEW